MIKKLLTLLFFMTGVIAYGQYPDSTIYSSRYEKELFTKYLSGNPVSVIEILKAVNYTADSETFESRIHSFCEEMKLDGIERYKTKKFINTLFERVHEHFLKKYEEIAFFDQIFSEGLYNCVTATALYVIVFDYFKVDYVIYETSDHVYMIADPNGTSFLIETTLPNHGVITFDDRYKKNYLDYLLENKMISEWEYKSHSIDELFEKKYRTHTKITGRQLAALQYYNAGVENFDHKQYMDALHNFEKMNIFHPSTDLNFLLSNTLVNLLIEQNAQRIYQAEILAKYIEVNKHSAQAFQVSKDFFTEVSNELTINHPSSVVYKSYFKKLMETFPDSLSANDFEEIYNAHLAYYYYVKKNYNQVIYYAGNSYRLNPENLQTRQMLYEALLGNFQELDEQDKLTADSLIHYALQFPFLLENKIICQGISMMLQNEYNHTDRPREEINSSNIKKLEFFAWKINSLNPGMTIVEEIYADAIKTNVGLYRFDVATAYLKSGLKQFPESDTLKKLEHYARNSQVEYEKFAKSIYSRVPAPNSITVPNYIIPPNYKPEEVTASVRKYLNTSWNVDFFKKDGKKRETEVNQLRFTFYPDTRVKFKTGTEEHWGKWKLESSGPKLIIQGDEDGEKFVILIYEAGPTQMRGIVSPHTAENKKIEFNVIRK